MAIVCRENGTNPNSQVHPSTASPTRQGPTSAAAAGKRSIGCATCTNACGVFTAAHTPDAGAASSVDTVTVRMGLSMQHPPSSGPRPLGAGIRTDTGLVGRIHRLRALDTA